MTVGAADVFPSGTNFVIDDNDDGDVVAAAMIGNNVWATYKGAGDETFGEVVQARNPSGGVIEFAPDTIGIAFGHEGMAVWVLTAVELGDTAPSEWISGDDYSTWTKVE